MKRAVAMLGALLAVVMPAVAAACPQCAGRSDGGIARALVLGAFVMFPFAVVACVVRVIRSGERDEPRPPSSHGRPGGGPQRGPLRGAPQARALPANPRPT